MSEKRKLLIPSRLTAGLFSRRYARVRSRLQITQARRGICQTNYNHHPTFSLSPVACCRSRYLLRCPMRDGGPGFVGCRRLCGFLVWRAGGFALSAGSVGVSVWEVWARFSPRLMFQNGKKSKIAAGRCNRLSMIFCIFVAVSKETENGNDLHLI